jgi:DNA-binding response OmpR family regulator
MGCDSELWNVPLVFVTAQSRESVFCEIRESGLDPDVVIAAYVSKPFVAEELIAEIRRVLLRAEAPGTTPRFRSGP